MILSGGIPAITDYQEVLRSKIFEEMRRYSEEFIARHAYALFRYRLRWVRDPLHQWSRQWEYPYVYTHVTGDRILDAGSGVTFFPYYVADNQGAEVICCDADKSLEKIYRRIGGHVKFRKEDICDLSFQDEYFDCIYCISVLEHVDDYLSAIKEFKRVLKKGGRLVVTFDISLDGTADIPISAANELLEVLTSEFSPVDDFPSTIGDFGERVTTHMFRGKKSLPWKFKFKPLTFCCCTLQK